MENNSEKLPPRVEQFISSHELDKKLENINTTHKLHIDQVADLRDEIVLLMFGTTKPEDFITHIMEELKITYDVASKIAADVNEQIFLEVREAMKTSEIHPADVMLSQKTVTVAPPPAAPAPQALSAAKPEPPAPKPYSADPYREPIEP